MAKQIIFAHLLNDTSGSPKVLAMTIAALLSSGKFSGQLFVGSDGHGCLERVDISRKKYWYKRMQNRWATLFTYFFSQMNLFFCLLLDRSIDKDAIVYCNTLLPFGAALYGYVTGRRVFYHVHEISIKPFPLRLFLVGVVRLTSSLNIYVSESHKAALPIKGGVVLPNALPDDFLNRVDSFSKYESIKTGVFRVLMVASLRDYKGVPEFLELAASVLNRSDIVFELLANDSPGEVDLYMAGRVLPGNLKVYSRVADTTPFYSRASLLVNLSRIDQCVETFGLTILEAMAFGVPVVVPPVGGPTELVQDGVQGYLIDSRDLRLLRERVLQLADSPSLCRDLSVAASLQARNFGCEAFEKRLTELVQMKE